MSDLNQLTEDPRNPRPVAFVDPDPTPNPPNPRKADQKDLGPFPIWTAADFAAYKPLTDQDILGIAILRQGQLTLLMG